jgi:hypothetical protein
MQLDWTQRSDVSGYEVLFSEDDTDDRDEC